MISPAANRFVIDIGRNGAVARNKIVAVIIGNVDCRSCRR
jgi:hypothetical protein